jgi:hypothetical protein
MEILSNLLGYNSIKSKIKYSKRDRMNSVMNVIYNLVDNSILKIKNDYVSFKVNNVEIMLCTQEVRNLTGTFHLNAEDRHIIFLSPVQVQDVKIECITMLALANIQARNIQITASGEICTLGAELLSDSPLKLESKCTIIKRAPKDEYVEVQSFIKSIKERDKQALLENLINATENIHPDFVRGHGMDETIDVIRVLKFWNFIQ